jgi:hypothetical protein
VSTTLGLVAYYGSRALGASPLDALLVSTVISAVRVAYSALKDRRFDPIAWFLMAADGITLAVGVFTQSPITTMFGQQFPGVVFLAFVIGGLALGRPVHRVAGELAQAPLGGTACRRTQLDVFRCPSLSPYAHEVDDGCDGCASDPPRCRNIRHPYTVDVAKGAIGLLALATDIAVLVIALGGIGRFLMHHRTYGASSSGRGHA